MNKDAFDDCQRMVKRAFSRSSFVFEWIIVDSQSTLFIPSNGVLRKTWAISVVRAFVVPFWELGQSVLGLIVKR